MTSRNLVLVFNSIVFTLLLMGCNKDSDPVAEKVYEEKVVVANRGNGTISLIDANTNAVSSTIAIAGSEPMYAVYVPTKDKIYVGDRLGKKVHIVNPQSKAVEGFVNVGNGVFHMWADGLGKQLWVNNDVDNTISVIDLATHTVVQTINVGAKPHDVFLTKDGTKAFVSIITSSTTNDKVYLYNSSNYTKTAEVNVGKDPHLFHLQGSNRLFVPCQSGQIYTLNGSDLTVISNSNFVGAHGIFATNDQNYIFATNIAAGQLYGLNASNSSQIGAATTTPTGTPHNITINESGTKLFISHSGAAATAVTIYNLNAGAATYSSTTTAGTNPFGITYYKREVK